MSESLTGVAGGLCMMPVRTAFISGFSSSSPKVVRILHDRLGKLAVDPAREGGFHRFIRVTRIALVFPPRPLP